MKEKFKFVLIVLVYRNISDLVECIESVQKEIPSCKVIVINAYYDDESLNKARDVAETNNCDFYNIENKGYSYGNNYGISKANEYYNYEYVIVSNPDITVDKFDDSKLVAGKVYAPKIIAKSGRNQNPMVIKRNALAEHLIYIGLKKNNKYSFISGLALNKITRAIHQWKNHDGFKIYQAHGSFVIISKEIVDKLHPIYDENMFLFAEEGVMAVKVNNCGFDTIYTDNIVIHHKEDGSMSLGGLEVNDELKKANIYFYEQYLLKK